MAVAIPSDEAARFVPGLRRSHSQPKFSSKQTGFRQFASASRISDVRQQQQQQPSQSQPLLGVSVSSRLPTRPSAQAYQQIPVFSDSSATSSLSSSPRASPAAETAFDETLVPSPSKLLVPSLRLPHRLDRPGYGSSPNGTDDGTFSDVAVAIDCPHYDGVSYFNPSKDYDSSASSIRDAYVPSPNGNNTLSSTGPSRTNSLDFDLFEHAAEDDTAVRPTPSRHVDYLSHNWKEEDIWESWKYIVSRRGDYSNSARLENASWRTWMKSKNKLKTVSPETLNWLKDCDVTWLYGPLQTGHDTLTPGTTTDSVDLTKTNSFLAGSKKPILKKRSMSEIMLQRSISTSSLIKQAASAVQAQQRDPAIRKTTRPRLERAITDYVTFPFSSHQFTATPNSQLQSHPTSGVASPSSERKHIHFNEQVEQCIAVDVKDDDDDDNEDDGNGGLIRPYNGDSDSDDGAIMMKCAVSRHRMQPHRRHSYMNHASTKATPGATTIAMLPSTTLKYRDDVPDVSDPASMGSAMKHSYRSPVLSPSSSQETLRPTKPSSNMFIEGDDDDDENNGENEVEIGAHQRGDMLRRSDNQAEFQKFFGAKDDVDDNESGSGSGSGSDSDVDMSMSNVRRRTQLLSSASTSRLNSLGAPVNNSLHSASLYIASGARSNGSGLKRTTSTSSLASTDPAGMHRTASGMLMPYDEGEPAGGYGGDGGLVGRVIDTVNTARDIVHVIWNVGWRR